MSNDFRCACFAEEIRASVDDDGMVELAIWQYSGLVKGSWRQRLRHIWRVLRTGDPYNDHVILYPDQAREFGRWLVFQTARNEQDLDVRYAKD